MPAQKNFSSSRQKRLSMPIMRVCVPGAQYSFWRSNNNLFLVAWSRGLHFWKELKISSRCYWRCLLSWQVLFQQREMRIYWRLCNSSEIHLWLWKVWSLVVCSQSSFYVEHVKTTQTDKTCFFFAKKRWTWYPTNNYYLMSHSNQPNIERKNCVWTTQYERLSEMCIVQHVEKKMCFTIQPKKRLVSTTVKSAKLAATFWIFFLRTKKRQLCCLAVTVHIASQKDESWLRKRKAISIFEEISLPNHNQAHLNQNQKRLNWVQIWNKRIHFLLVDGLSHFLNFQIILFNFNLQSTCQLTANLHKIIKIFLVSNDGIQWTLDFGPDSVTISVNDLNQNVTITSKEIPLAAWQLLLSQRQEILNNHLAQVPITPNQQGTFEMREEVLSSVGAQDLDTSSYQVFHLEDIEFNWEISQLDMDAVFRPGIDNPFSPKKFDDLLMGDGSVENPIVLDEEEDKENAPPPTTPESARPTEPPRLQRSRAFGARMENVPDYVFRKLFH